MRGNLTAAYDPEAPATEQIAEQVSALGFECRPWQEPPFLEGSGHDLLTAVSGLALTPGFAVQALRADEWLVALVHQHEGESLAAVVSFSVAKVSAAALVVPKAIKSLAAARPT